MNRMALIGFKCFPIVYFCYFVLAAYGTTNPSLVNFILQTLVFSVLLGYSQEAHAKLREMQ